MRASGWLKLGLGVAVIGIAAAAAFRKPKLEAIDIVAAKARKATIVRKIRAAGHVEPVTQVRVSASISGDLLSLNVKEGDTVDKGTLIAEIEPKRLTAVVRQAEASTRSAEAAVRLEQTQLAEAEAAAKRASDLHAKGLTTAVDLDRARARIDVTEARIDGAKQRVEQARASMDEAKARLQQTRLTAPIDGTVIRLLKKVGERIRGSDLAEDVLLILAPLHAMEVEVEVSEQEVVNVAIGQAAEIEVDALEDEAISGKVVEIASSATIRFRGEERETTSFRVKVALDTIPDRLRSGMSAAVSIVTATHVDTIAVPIEAVTARLPSQLTQRAEDVLAKKKTKRIWDTSDDEEELVVRRREKPERIVFVVSGNKVEPKKVVTGISSEEDFEIISGIGPGDEVVVGPYRALARELLPGSLVNVVDRMDTTTAKPQPIAAEK